MVSIILPCYNASLTIREAISSIINQTYRDWELIVVDDASLDGSLEIIHEFEDARVRVVSERENIGLVRSLNLGISMAHGEWIARQDADDVSCPDRLERQLEKLQSENLDICGGHAVMFNDKGTCGFFFAPIGSTAIALRLLFTVPFAHSSVVMRRDFLLTNGLSYSTRRTTEDYYLWSECFGKGARFGNVDSIVLKLRISGNSLSSVRRHKVAADTRRIGMQNRRDYNLQSRRWLREYDALEAFDAELYFLLALRLGAVGSVLELIRRFSKKPLFFAILRYFRGD